MTVHEDVIKTAYSALNAKVSMLAAGYEPVPINNAYYKCLMQRMMEHRTKSNAPRNKKTLQQQSPLVNAGYATRVSIVSTLIHNYVSYLYDHDEEQCSCVNIVILGCGLDMLGLWSLSLASSALTTTTTAASSPTINVFEIDCKEIITQKKEALRQTGILEEIEEQQAQNGNKYSLLEMDLSNVAEVERELVPSIESCIRSNGNAPTLVISELVVAYIVESTRKDLFSILSSSSILQHPGSLLFLYEPIGPITTTNKPYTDDCDVNQTTTMTQFSNHYFSKFQTKLSSQGDSKPQCTNQVFFKPLGASHAKITDLFHKCGYLNTNSSFAGHIASNIALSSSSSSGLQLLPQAFDEYASLVLHLNCYTVVYASLHDNNQYYHDDSNDTDYNIANFFSSVYNSTTRSKHASELQSSPLSQHNTKTNQKSFDITIILNQEEDNEVAALYTSVYKPYVAHYKCIQKMVKNAFKINKSSQSSFAVSADSLIFSTYEKWGGTFYIAKSLSEKDEDTVVVGCIGTKKCNHHPTYPTNTKPLVPTYEIHRFAVDTKHQNQGIGNQLLNHVIQSLSSSSSSNLVVPKPFSLIAITPTILKKANTFYKKNGFRIVNERILVDVDDFVLRTYEKTYACNCNLN